jgi:hypothetical protein
MRVKQWKNGTLLMEMRTENTAMSEPMELLELKQTVLCVGIGIITHQ